MHELSFCKEIIDIASQEINKLEKKPLKINTIRIVVGELHQLIDENMVFLFNELTKNTIIQGTALDIIHMPIKIECNDCGFKGKIKNSFYLCEKCGKGNLNIIQGKELYIKNIEIEE